MNLVDLGVLVVLAVSALLGLSRGLVREMLGLGSWLLAGYGAYRFSPEFVPMARQAIGNPDIADPAAYVGVFVILLIALSLLANLVGRMVRVSALGGLDRMLGLLFGAARGAIILVAAYIPLALMLPPEKWPAAALNARSLPYIYDGAVRVVAEMPLPYRPRVVPPPNGTPIAPDTTIPDATTPDATPHDTPDAPTHATPEPNVVGPPPPPPTSPI